MIIGFFDWLAGLFGPKEHVIKVKGDFSKKGILDRYKSNAAKARAERSTQPPGLRSLFQIGGARDRYLDETLVFHVGRSSTGKVHLVEGLSDPACNRNSQEAPTLFEGDIDAVDCQRCIARIKVLSDPKHPTVIAAIKNGNGLE
ncbi:MAG: hypothetical protein IV100_09120 [Myxococcales bacterium]|nr:hypothetical protein [Myxococcales bacterium]